MSAWDHSSMIGKVTMSIALKVGLIGLAALVAIASSARPSKADSPAPALPDQTPFLESLTAVYQDLSRPYKISTPEQIAEFGRLSLDKVGLDRLYSLWMVLHIYDNDTDADKLKALLVQVERRAAKDNDKELQLLADFFEVCYRQVVQYDNYGSHSDFSRFLTRSGPNLRIMALVEEAEKQSDAKHWSAAAALASEGLQEAEQLGPRTLAVQAELHQSYADTLAEMGYSRGAINQLIEAVRIDPKVEAPTRHLERIWSLATAAQQAGESDMADKFARLHFRYASASTHTYWTHYLCAATAAGRQNWRRVLACLDGVKARLDVPKTQTDASFLKWRAMARARLGDVEGARADLIRFNGPLGASAADPSTAELDRIYLEQAQRPGREAFEALDRWRRGVEADEARLHASQMNDVASALQAQLKRKSAESALFAEGARLARGLSIAWSLIAALFAVMVLGSIGWIAHLNRAARRLREATRLAEAANEAKSRFLANMSHELRTPLNGMLGMAQALSLDRLTPAQAAQVRTLHESSETLLAILNDVLDLSALDSDRLQIAPQLGDLADVVQGVADVYASTAAANGTELTLRLDPDLPRDLLFDRVRVRQCLCNLVSNAVKFTEQGKISIEVSAAPDTTSDRLRITVVVADTGIGMSREIMDGLFGSFMQADTSAARRFGGAGLGLSITQRLATLMNGAVSVESEVGRGSVFTLTFLADAVEQPAADPSSPGADDAPALAAGVLEGVRVLVVDDHPVNRQVASLLLQTLGCEIAEAEDGCGAIEQLERQAFDLVLMDINMPVMDGLEATQRIRANPCWSDLAIVALTACASDEHRRLCLSKGMSGYLAKPINTAALLGAISELAAAA